MKTVRMKDVADACGVSVATVSRALNGLADENGKLTALICRKAQEMGYVQNAAALTLKTNRANCIGILYEDRMNHEYFSSLLDDIRRESNARGYDLMLIGSSEETERNYYEHVRKRNLDGVIVIQADFESSEVIRLASSPMPSVIIDHMYEGCDCVCSDNRNGIASIVRFVYEKGHRRIGFITGEKGNVSNERLAGFYKACAELGIRVPEGFVRETHFHHPEEGVRIIRDMMNREEGASCILCPDDFSCIGAIWELQKQGISVPEKVSLVGYDGIRGRMMPFELTTYRQNTEGIARETVKLLLEAIEEPENHKPRQITVEGELVRGETVSELSR